MLRATHPSTTTFAPLAASLPVDRVSDLLVLSPGVTTTDDGQLNVRNGGRGGNGLYVDGVPVIPGLRNGFSPTLGGSYLNPGGPGVGIGTNGFRQLSLTTGLTPLDRGHAIGGIIDVETAPCASEAPAPAVFRAGLASDAMFGASHGLGYNRFTVDGLARSGRLEVGGGVVIEGQKSDRLGLGQNDSPIYLRDGVDTTVTFDRGDGNMLTVDVDRFRASDGIRIPSSAKSSYTLSGQATYYLGERHRLRLSGLASQVQGRVFDYGNLYNPRQAFGNRYWSQVLTASWFGELMERGTLRLSAEAHASLQWDHVTEAPLSTSGEVDTRDPGLGLMLSPLGFRFSQSNFPVNDELIENFRSNTGRLSPYDLTNTIQYQLTDQYRNNAYGITGFSEGGGPVGTTTFSDERRLVGSGTVTAEVGERHRFRVGVEAIHYNVKLYTSGLTSQAFAEAFIEEPSSQAAFGEYRLELPELTLSGGLRYDRFNSGASRPEFPRISSFPSEFIDDEAHARLSPRMGVVYHGTPRLRMFGGYTALAQAPDLRFLYAGINTDLSTTNSSQPFGTDLDFERTGLFEVGAEYLLDSVTTISGTLWSRADKDRVVFPLSSELDPFRGSNVDIRRIRNGADANSVGLDASVTRALGKHGQAWLSYGFVSPDDDLEVLAQQRDVRKHTLAVALLYETGADTRALGGLLRNTGVYAAFRYAIGTAYTACPELVAEDASVLSSEGICSRSIEGDFFGAHLPPLKMFDLRVSRGFEVGGTQLTAFADARNLFNWRTITQVFAQTGDIVNERERLSFRQGQVSEFANEADANGAYTGDHSVDLSFGGAANPRAACGNWTNASGVASVPNCIYLLNAEEHFGNGDHIFTEAEQARAVDAYYYVARGEQNFTGSGRRVRLGIEVRF
ncbi:MAG TPA: hypothetical protein VG817_11560 [Gemmatimonadales bacterium]|nr:hypothetical protein [Gemmatimonadales bacterium]